MMCMRTWAVLCFVLGALQVGVAGCSGGGSCSCADQECGDDGCGQSCGTCPGVAPYCVDNQCAINCSPSCAGKECGDDGCGGSCGSCPAAAPHCVANLCAVTSGSSGTSSGCTSNCAGKTCGHDGCGGSCGTCPGGTSACGSDGLCAFGAFGSDGDGSPPPGVANSFLPLRDVTTGASQSLGQGRVGHTVTYTAHGEVVIAGGGVPNVDGSPWWTRDGLGGFLNSVEIVDAATHATTVHSVLDGAGQPQGGLTFPRAWHTATALPTGQIFFAGGWTENNGQRESLAYVEWYEPSGSIAVLQQPLDKARAGHTATLVDPHPDRFTILFVGGDADDVGTYELWSPTTGTSGALPLPQNQKRRFHAAVAATVNDDNGNPMDVVVIYGGEDDNGLLASGLFFVVPNEMMMEHPSPLAKGERTHLTATYVNKQGLIYFIGGHKDKTHSEASEAIDVYDTRAASWQLPFLAGTGDFNLNNARGGHSTSLVDDTTLVVMGGSAGAETANDMEVIHEVLKISGDTEVQVDNLCFGDSADTAGCSLPIPALPEAREGHHAVVLDSGSILLVGGGYESPTPVLVDGGHESPTAGFELVEDLDLFFSPQ